MTGVSVELTMGIDMATSEAINESSTVRYRHRPIPAKHLQSPDTTAPQRSWLLRLPQKPRSCLERT